MLNSSRVAMPFCFKSAFRLGESIVEPFYDKIEDESGMWKSTYPEVCEHDLLECQYSIRQVSYCTLLRAQDSRTRRSDVLSKTCFSHLESSE